VCIITYADAIAKRIRQICLDKNITLNKLADLSGLRQSTLDNIVKGNTKNPTLRTLHRIAVGLNMTVSELLDFKIMNESVFEDE
jgi:transcriptional regulator with XRE-family HTH domain